MVQSSTFVLVSSFILNIFVQSIKQNNSSLNIDVLIKKLLPKTEDNIKFQILHMNDDYERISEPKIKKRFGNTRMKLTKKYADVSTDTNEKSFRNSNATITGSKGLDVSEESDVIKKYYRLTDRIRLNLSPLDTKHDVKNQPKHTGKHNFRTEKNKQSVRFVVRKNHKNRKKPTELIVLVGNKQYKEELAKQVIEEKKDVKEKHSDEQEVKEETVKKEVNPKIENIQTRFKIKNSKISYLKSNEKQISRQELGHSLSDEIFNSTKRPNSTVDVIAPHIKNQNLSSNLKRPSSKAPYTVNHVAVNENLDLLNSNAPKGPIIEAIKRYIFEKPDSESKNLPEIYENRKPHMVAIQFAKTEHISHHDTQQNGDNIKHIGPDKRLGYRHFSSVTQSSVIPHVSKRKRPIERFSKFREKDSKEPTDNLTPEKYLQPNQNKTKIHKSKVIKPKTSLDNNKKYFPREPQVSEEHYISEERLIEVKPKHINNNVLREKHAKNRKGTLEKYQSPKKSFDHKLISTENNQKKRKRFSNEKTGPLKEEDTIPSEWNELSETIADTIVSLVNTTAQDPNETVRDKFIYIRDAQEPKVMLKVTSKLMLSTLREALSSRRNFGSIIYDFFKDAAAIYRKNGNFKRRSA